MRAARGHYYSNNNIFEKLETRVKRVLDQDQKDVRNDFNILYVYASMLKLLR